MPCDKNLMDIIAASVARKDTTLEWLRNVNKDNPAFEFLFPHSPDYTYFSSQVGQGVFEDKGNKKPVPVMNPELAGRPRRMHSKHSPPQSSMSDASGVSRSANSTPVDEVLNRGPSRANSQASLDHSDIGIEGIFNNLRANSSSGFPDSSPAGQSSTGSVVIHDHSASSSVDIDMPTRTLNLNDEPSPMRPGAADSIAIGSAAPPPLALGDDFSVLNSGNLLGGLDMPPNMMEGFDMFPLESFKFDQEFAIDGGSVPMVVADPATTDPSALLDHSQGMKPFEGVTEDMPAILQDTTTHPAAPMTAKKTAAPPPIRAAGSDARRTHRRSISAPERRDSIEEPALSPPPTEHSVVLPNVLSPLRGVDPPVVPSSPSTERQQAPDPQSYATAPVATGAYLGKSAHSRNRSHGSRGGSTAGSESRDIGVSPSSHPHQPHALAMSATAMAVASELDAHAAQAVMSSGPRRRRSGNSSRKRHAGHKRSLSVPVNPLDGSFVDASSAQGSDDDTQSRASKRSRHTRTSPTLSVAFCESNVEHLCLHTSSPWFSSAPIQTLIPALVTAIGDWNQDVSECWLCVIDALCEVNERAGIETLCARLEGADSPRTEGYLSRAYIAIVLSSTKYRNPGVGIRALSKIVENSVAIEPHVVCDWVVMLTQSKETEIAVPALDVLFDTPYLLDLDIDTLQELVDILCQHEDVERALKLFEIMRKLPEAVRVDTFNSLFRGCWLARQESKAEYLIDVMQTEGIMFNALTYRYIIDVFTSSNNQLLLEHFYEMGVASGVYSFHNQETPFFLDVSDLSSSESALALPYHLRLLKHRIHDGLPIQAFKISCDLESVAGVLARDLHDKYHVTPLTSFIPDTRTGRGSEVVLLPDDLKKCLAQVE